ncbi:Cytochrome c-type biogenesis protein CcmF [Rhodobacteraceae bacterium THAF1]|uniref:heme lyase CcmF/NrfE family subunit n=1 Tax=Palleronia sp. THAF1 TaxID=2587842 RepID=UPI000F3DDE12|nr:heme lyase CcmF/NrfE family subunit [Palleronia sp. THAF1]QFU08225.1 Cytochrome c-type biogenesis protein CcmF [Palleronia sp. THAF1]VDC28779.1 Cytochrome c-type biogenesis protein CcmF [Rhodobacteraceae bacterium THAF1]
MIIELGHFALILALIMAALQCVLPLVGAQKGWSGFMAAAAPAAQAQFLFLGFSFAVLTWAFVASDFSLAVVTANSHTAKPLIYKISGVWGNHEGSMLLWCVILAFYSALAAWFGGNLSETLRARVLGVQGAICVAFLAFLIFTSNPFWRLEVPPLNGQDLNPLLQDPGLAFHPPFLYLGYVGLSMAFSFAVAALIEGRVDAAWGRWVRPWTLVAWVFLTIGIALGSWWAYYELGWGGFWFWDPVENASFMPWLIAAALLHSSIVVEKREALKSWTILLAILAFGFSLIGAFIVRSGVLTSVHAFANDPERGVYLLAITGIFMGGALTLYAARAASLEAKGVFALVSRESALVANNILLAVSAFVVFVGTVWPLVAEMIWDRKLSVGAPFFDAAFTPFMVVLAALLPIGGLMPWKRARMDRLAQPLIGALALSIALGALVWVMQTGGSMLAPIGAVLAAWVVLGAVVDLNLRTGRDWSTKLARLRKLPRADWGKTVSHAGFGVTIFGVAALTAWQVEDIRVAQEGESFAVGPYEITLDSVREERVANYLTTIATMQVTRGGDPVATLQPEKRFYPVAQMPTTEAAIDNGVLRDLYLVIGDPQDAGGWAVRTYIKPFANWIWAGCIIMALGGGLSLTDRRHRVAAGAAKTPRRAVPAE